MNCFSINLLADTKVGLPGITCLTGGGGKTTLLFTLGKGLVARGKSGIGTTTTKMFKPTSRDSIDIFFTNNPQNIPEPKTNFLFVAKEATKEDERRLATGKENNEKVYGYTAHEIDSLSSRYPHISIVVEADGAARRPLKAPAIHEPVIPSVTRSVIAVIGLSCMYQPFLPEYVFRTEEVSAITGLTHGQIVTPEAVAKVVTHKNGLCKNTPQGASRYLFCNQSDVPGGVDAAKALGNILLKEYAGFFHGIYFGALEKDGLACVSMTK